MILQIHKNCTICANPFSFEIRKGRSDKRATCSMTVEQLKAAIEAWEDNRILDFCHGSSFCLQHG